MENFKVILKFTLNRRLRNKTFVYVNVLLGCLMILLFCCDFYIPYLFPTWEEKPTIMCSDTTVCNDLNYILQDFDFIEDEENRTSEYYFIDVNECYDIWVDSNANMLNVAKIEMALRQREELLLIEQGLLNLKPIYIHTDENEENSADTWGFMLITTVYFLALSFAGTVANDVVYEKATRMMEIILTSTTASIHLMAKLIGGWLSLLLQLAIFIGEFLICFIVRILYDKAEGLFSVLYKLGFVTKIEELSFSRLFEWFGNNMEMCGYLVIAFIVMFLGILLVQSILVILSSYISNIEEAGNIQSPFYLLLMGVYYLTLFVNNKESMTNGVGRLLSLLPFFSMLCMPCRIFYHSIPLSDLLISVVSALSAIVLVLMLGTPIYQKGVLDYSASTKQFKL